MCAAATTVAPRRRTSAAGVLASGMALGGLGITVAVVDPTAAGWLPPCPFHTLTGWWCPGCGLTRATHHLLRGEVGAALSYHLFVPVVLAAIVVGWWSTLQVSLGRPAIGWPRRVPRALWIGVGVAIGVFSVARNLAPLSALAPGP
jgi:hypothetical protein